MSSLLNKVIIVTGGNGLIGKEIIKTLTFQGANCINLDINNETNELLTNINCDVTNFSSIDKSIDLVLKK